MSADAWRVCPRCEVKRQKEIEDGQAAVEAAYGNVHSEEYIRLISEQNQLETERAPETLREDYEIWMDEDGKFSVSYHGGCATCGFSFEYKFSKQVPLS
jgi:hypothetical protein